MKAFGLTRKQCGVIFANIKRGNLDLPADFAKWMYDHIEGGWCWSDNTQLADVYSRMHRGLDNIFADEIEEAQEALTEAYNVYHIYFTAA